MNRIWITIALSLALATPALADGDRPFRPHDRERIADRLEQRGERINARLDRQADHVERRFEQRAEQAEALGKQRLAGQLRTKGERLARHLDRRGDRIEARFERRAEHIEKHFDHQRAHSQTYRHYDRHDHACGPRHRDHWHGEHLALQLNGLGISWSHRH